VISATALTCRFAHGPALQFLDRAVPQEGMVLLRGASGLVKSTWLAVAADLLAPTMLPRSRVVIADEPTVSLGDIFCGFRIAGTTPDCISHGRVPMAQGTQWTQPKQAAVGVLAARGFVLDRRPITRTESVRNGPETHTALDEEDQKILPQDWEVTRTLIRYKTLLTAVALPRLSTTTEMQATTPAQEITRLLRTMGVGTNLMKALTSVLLLSALLPAWEACRVSGFELLPLLNFHF
jgi:putative ABC transport system permease protein